MRKAFALHDGPSVGAYNASEVQAGDFHDFSFTTAHPLVVRRIRTDHGFRLVQVTIDWKLELFNAGEALYEVEYQPVVRVEISSMNTMQIRVQRTVESAAPARCWVEVDDLGSS